MEEENATTKKVRRKSGLPRRKRVVFKKPPPPAIPVRGLWEHASEEDRERSHITCMAILEYWLGRATKQEIAERLEVTPLRVWQLSSQALSGMLAGLLHQPRRRGKVPSAAADPRNDPVVLKRRIAELEEKLSRTEDLVRLLKELPWKPTPAAAGKERSHARRRKRVPPKRAKSGRPAFPGVSAMDRRDDASGGAETG
jgi:hypothetical protein